MTISELADNLGVSTDTLRYYERLGLLHPANRTAAGYRLYDEVATERLRFIRGTQRMGLRLADVKELLDVQDRGRCPCGHTRTLVRRRIAEVNAELKELAALKTRLLELKKRNDECIDATTGTWSCAVGIGEGGEP